MSGLDVRLERLLATTPETAFHHWVDPGERRRWCRGGLPAFLDAFERTLPTDRSTDRSTDEGEVR